jgi:hypothetical protein
MLSKKDTADGPALSFFYYRLKIGTKNTIKNGRDAPK